VDEILRRAATSDIDDLMAIETASYSEPFTREVFLQFLKDPSCICVLAQHNEHVVGYALVAINLELSQLLSIAVQPDRRSTGIARRLLAGVMDYCRSAGAENMRLEVRSANHAARRLYEAMGFSLIGIRAKYYGNDDALVMRAQLQLED
jgi:ribosomal-protein-alanine N-acetyltransferase